MTAMQPEQSELLCVMLPVAGGSLPLPNVVVAEVLPMRRLTVLDDRPPWCAGTLDWRGLEVPVIRFSVLNGREAGDPQGGRCIAMLNRVRNRQGTPFYGLLADALPRLVHLTERDIENHKAALGPADVAMVRVGAELATIPNLTHIESALATLRSDAPASR
jgi:chemosensory pili system protein ChpC